MAQFEVYLTGEIRAPGFRLVSSHGGPALWLELAHGQSWREALEHFAAGCLGEIPSFVELKGIETPPGEPPRLIVQVKVDLPRKAPVLSGDCRWAALDEPPGGGTPGARLDPALEVELYTDGGSRGNPGPAAVGFVLRQAEGGFVEERGLFIGTSTNNEAEYRALEEGLKLALERGARQVAHFSDSQLLVRQLEGSYQVKAPELVLFFGRVKALSALFERFRTCHIPREKNARADWLANQALNRQAAGALGEPLPDVQNTSSGQSD